MNISKFQQKIHRQFIKFFIGSWHFLRIIGKEKRNARKITGNLKA